MTYILHNKNALFRRPKTCVMLDWKNGYKVIRMVQWKMSALLKAFSATIKLLLPSLHRVYENV